MIGIAGASASGKSLIASTLYRELREQVGDEHIGVIAKTAITKDQSHIWMKDALRQTTTIPRRNGIAACCFERPQALKRGSAIDLPVYSYVEHTRMKETVTVQPKKVVAARRHLLLTDARCVTNLTLRFFVDTRWISA
ncbi:hypothetical protein ACNKHL_12595 [Shigella flexneri]